MNTKDGKKVKVKKVEVKLEEFSEGLDDLDPVEAAPVVDPAPELEVAEAPKLDTRPMTPENFPDKFDIFGNLN